MKLWKSLLALLAAAALTMTSTVLAGQPDGNEAGGNENGDSTVYEDRFDTQVLFEPEEETAEKTYTAYTVAPSAVIMVNDGGSFRFAYCYNHNYISPSFADGTEYYDTVDFAGQGYDDNTKKQVEALLHVGYPFDALGYRAAVGGHFIDNTPKEFKLASDSVLNALQAQNITFSTGDYWAAAVTQSILWSILDEGMSEKGLNDLYESAEDYTEDGGYYEYAIALYKYAMEAAVPSSDRLIFSGIDAESNEKAEIVLQKADDGEYYQSNPIICEAYSGSVTLDVPEGFKAYVADSAGNMEEVNKISTAERFYLRCTSAEAAQDFNEGASLRFKGSYSYKTVDKFILYRTESVFTDEHNKQTPYQNLFSFTEKGDTSFGTFTISKASGGFEPEDPDAPTSSETTSSETTSSETTSSDTTSSETTSSETTSSDTISSDATSSETASSDAASSENTSSNPASSDLPSSDTEEIPEESVPTTNGNVIFNPPAGDESIDFPQNETVDIGEDDVPLAAAPQELTEILEDDVPLTNISDEDVPLGREPQTGDSTNSGLAARLLAVSLSGMAVLALVMHRLSRREKEEEQD